MELICIANVQQISASAARGPRLGVNRLAVLQELRVGEITDDEVVILEEIMGRPEFRSRVSEALYLNQLGFQESDSPSSTQSDGSESASEYTTTRRQSERARSIRGTSVELGPSYPPRPAAGK